MSGLIYATTRLQRKTPEISTLSRNPLQPIFNYGQNTIAGDEHGQIPPAYTLPEPRFSFDFSKVPVHSKNRELMHGTEEVETTDRTDGPKAEAPKREPIMSVPVSVDRIDIIDSPKGAIGGFPPTRGGDLNVPGPLNKDMDDGFKQVSNVHQIHFHLDGITIKHQVFLLRNEPHTDAIYRSPAHP